MILDKDYIFIGSTTGYRNSFQVTNIITSGGYSETYRVVDRSTDVSYLLKIYFPDRLPELMKNSAGEMNLIKYLGCSNIPKILGVVDWGKKIFFSSPGRKSKVKEADLPFVVTRYFSGDLLSDRLLVSGPLGFRDSVKIALDIVSDMASLKGFAGPMVFNFCHCDINPTNIILDKDPRNGLIRARLIDIDHLTHIPQSGETKIYTYDTDKKYQPLKTASLGVVDQYNDLYSVGTVLFECIYGYSFWDKEVFPDTVKDSVIQTIFRDFTGTSDEDTRFTVPEAYMALKSLYNVVCSEKWDLIDSRKDGVGADDLRNMFIMDLVNHGYNDCDVYEDDEEIASEGMSTLDKFIDSAIGEDGAGLEKQTLGDEEFTSTELGYTPMVKKASPDAGGFDDVAGFEKLKDQVSKKVLFFLKDPDLAKQYKIRQPNGMLLYGPPGCGKTFFAEKFAEESGFNFAIIKASDLASTWIHGSQGKIALLFKEARAKAPCIICFDEFDAFAPDRTNVTNTNISGEVNEFLSQLNNCGDDRVFIIATTNNPEGIDSAVLRSGRLDTKIYIPVPDFEARKAVLEMNIKKRPHNDDIDFDHLAKLTEGYVTSDLAYICNDAAMNAAYAKTLISRQLIEQCIVNFGPSVPKFVLDNHERIRDRFESSKDVQARGRIGFK